MRILQSQRCLLAIIIGTLSTTTISQADQPLRHRWVYLSKNLQVDDQYTQAEQILRRAKVAGYNGVVYADFKLNVLDRVIDRYFKNVAKLKRVAEELKLELIPTVAPFGYSSGILVHDPNLAEGLPAKDVRFIVREGRAVPVEDERLKSLPGDFEKRDGDAFIGWGFQDDPGAGTYADTKVVHGGACALRIENPAGVRGVNRRVSKRLNVRPYHQYHASVWIKTDDFASASQTRLFAIGGDTNRVLNHQNLGVQRTQDWTQHHVVFNSLGAEQLNIYCGVWGAGNGRLWMDDFVIEEAPLVNVVQRPGCPLTIIRENGKPLQAGVDYRPVVDARMTELANGGDFEIYHAPPTIELLPAAALKDGDRLKVNFYHAVSIYDGQVPASLTEPASFAWFEHQIDGVDKLLTPERYFFSHDEIRVANWSATESAAGKTAGEVLAANVAKCAEIVRRRSPQAKLCVWSDMFDPHHNARNDFYLVHQTLAGSWEGLPRDMLIINWNSGEPAKSTKFFADRGHEQVLAGYYDAPVEHIRDWLAASRGQKVVGVMYTTWQDNFRDLEAFAKVAWGE